MSYKKLKNFIKTTIQTKTPENALKDLKKYKFKQLTGPVKGLLFDLDPLISFRAAELMGLISKEAAKENIEPVRDIMRQLMWNLNEESGGIGWGSVEAMAETASQNKKIFDEFYKIIISYADPESSSFLDHEDLHPGAAWAVGRLLKQEPEKGDYANYVIKILLQHKDPKVKGNALWAASNMKNISDLKPIVKNLLQNNEKFILYEEGDINTISISKMAENVLKKQI
ncbi:MAG: HEAT repeat domain-containing protein [Desulforegulaceae bacterium]|nr:HEAT repeat domain-containing protein [Desulforegulaceae bacterium]